MARHDKLIGPMVSFGIGLAILTWIASAVQDGYKDHVSLEKCKKGHPAIVAWNDKHGVVLAYLAYGMVKWALGLLSLLMLLLAAWRFAAENS